MGWPYSGVFKKKSGSKLGNKKTERAGYSFGSKLEAAVFDQLKLMEAAGEIKIVRTQASVYMTPAKILYKPDFECLDLRTDKTFYVEAKGFETPVWRIKYRLWPHFVEADLHIYKGTHSKPYLDEVLKGKS